VLSTCYRLFYLDVVLGAPFTGTSLVVPGELSKISTNPLGKENSSVTCHAACPPALTHMAHFPNHFRADH